MAREKKPVHKVQMTEGKRNIIHGTYVYTFEYDLMGNRTYMEKTLNGAVAEWWLMRVTSWFLRSSTMARRPPA